MVNLQEQRLLYKLGGNMDSRLNPFQDKMEKTLNNLLEEYSGIRAGRANPHVLDKLRVDYYGTPSPIQSVANVSVPEPRMIQIQPWEASMVKEIEKAIICSDLGINPTNDGKLIRLVFPELTEERRKELAKDIKKKGEEAKVATRNIRREAIDSIKKAGKEDGISDDEVKDLEDDAQKLTDKFIAKIDDAGITTTTHLQQEMLHYVPEVLINRNTASEEMEKLSDKALQSKKELDHIHIGYFSGSITHNDDFNMIMPVIIELMKTYHHLKLHIVGELELPGELNEYKEQIMQLPSICFLILQH